MPDISYLKAIEQNVDRVRIKTLAAMCLFVGVNPLDREVKNAELNRRILLAKNSINDLAPVAFSQLVDGVTTALNAIGNIAGTPISVSGPEVTSKLIYKGFRALDDYLVVHKSNKQNGLDAILSEYEQKKSIGLEEWAKLFAIND